MFWNVRDASFGQRGIVIEQSYFGCFPSPLMWVLFKGFSYQCLRDCVSITNPKNEKQLRRAQGAAPELAGGGGANDVSFAEQAMTEADLGKEGPPRQAVALHMANSDATARSHDRPVAEGPGKGRQYGRDQRKSRAARLWRRRRDRRDVRRRKSEDATRQLDEHMVRYDDASDYLCALTMLCRLCRFGASRAKPASLLFAKGESVARSLGNAGANQAQHMSSHWSL